MPKPVFIPAAGARRLDVFGGQVFLTMPTVGGGSGISVFEELRGPGDGPPLHVHHGEDEVFRVLEGRFRFQVGEQVFEGHPGDTAFLPRGVPHVFCNMGEGPGRLLIVLHPGGFERFFLDVAEQGLEVPRDMARVVELAARYRLDFLGPNPFIRTG